MTYDYDQKAIGERIEGELKKRNIRKGDLAIFVDKSGPSITGYVQGEYPIPADVLAGIIKLINQTTPDDPVTVDYLLFGTKPQPSLLNHIHAKIDLANIREILKKANELAQKLELDLKKVEQQNPIKSLRLDTEITELKKKIIHGQYKDNSEFESLLTKLLETHSDKILSKLISIMKFLGLV